MLREKKRSHIDINLHAKHISLKGTGVDVEPAYLSGHLSLFLTEPTSFKEITLQFRGKARIPVPSSKFRINGSPSLTYIVCNHEWSFLKGDRHHSSTLNAGHHYFPFQLLLGGSLPSSITSSALGHSSIAYKLRAVAVRPSLLHNLQAIEPVHIIRSFTREALEYQQTLEIENTWPEKIMYSIMIPHKAWAVGDRLTAIVKLMPLAKGIRALSVTTNISEATRIYARSGPQEDTSVVASTQHKIIRGKAFEISFDRPLNARCVGLQCNGTHTTNGQFTSATDFTGTTIFEYVNLLQPRASPPFTSSVIANNETSSARSGNESPELSNSEGFSTQISVQIPTNITPSHGLEPITITHRIRWSILILNPDGHSSALRCSLPVHILDYRIYDEARAFSAPTRRLVLGGTAYNVDMEDLEGRELPSYIAHVRDRVANMYLPEGATLRIVNPWVTSCSSPTQVDHDPMPNPSSAYTTPLGSRLPSHLPHAPGSNDSIPLDSVNSELLLSPSEIPLPLPSTRGNSFVSVDSHMPPEVSANDVNSAPLSRSRSSWYQSRASSPERNEHSSPEQPQHDTCVKQESTTRSIHALLKATVKAFLSFKCLSSTDKLKLVSCGEISSLVRKDELCNPSGPIPNSGPAWLHHVFTKVPEYSVAARGFIGGIPPLESMRGLPSYDESKEHDDNDLRRTTSDSDLVTHFSQGISIANERESGPRSSATSRSAIYLDTRGNTMYGCQ